MKITKKDIENMINKPMTPEIIKNIAKKPFNMILYSDIHKYKNLDQLFGNKRYVIILYEYKKYNGHYILLMKSKNGKIVEYFDSIYKYPDYVLKLLDDNTRKLLNEDELYLCDLLENSPYQIEYNSDNIQQRKTAICGGWCSLRIAYSDLTVEDFIDCFKNHALTPDEICTGLSIIRNNGYW